MMKVRPIKEWHEDMGDKLWWCLRGGEWLDEAPYVGSPLDCGLTVECHTYAKQPAARFDVGGWPGYHTHFTDIPGRPPAPTSSSGLSRGSTGPTAVATIDIMLDEAEHMFERERADRVEAELERLRAGYKGLAKNSSSTIDYWRNLAVGVNPGPFKRGDRVQCRAHADGRDPAYRFRGTVCGEYDNPATGEHGYNVSLAHDPGCIQNFPGYMLEPWGDDDGR